MMTGTNLTIQVTKIRRLGTRAWRLYSLSTWEREYDPNQMG